MFFLFHNRCLVLFFILFQCISLYEIYAYQDNHPYPSSSSSSEEFNSSIENQNVDEENNVSDMINPDNKDYFWKSKAKRAISAVKKIPKPQRRNNRPHWNPLIAAYKRCGELLTRTDRESCFKGAVQMLFVHKIRK